MHSIREGEMEVLSYYDQEREVSWQGVCFAGGQAFTTFMSTDVASRVNDEEGNNQYTAHLRSLATTGFAMECLEEILSAEIPEERKWAIGESLAEAYLSRNNNLVWPWNMARDKRTPHASLPGADLVGFEVDGENVKLVLGEVKTSSDTDSPPNVMNGRSGMAYQIENLANNLSKIAQLLKWLLPRCKGTEYEHCFNIAVAQLFRSRNRAITFIGVLIRDTEPNVRDLEGRGRILARIFHAPSFCKLIALHLPCAIADLPELVSGNA